MGSDSDLPVMQEACTVFEHFAVPYEITVSSAHRSPDRTAEFARNARNRGIEVIIAGAGWAAHLAGFIASETTLPVIGVPIDSSPLNGLDALLATVQMPGGVPVATMTIGKAGAHNAAVFAVQILSLKHPALQEKLIEFKQDLSEKVEKKARDLEQKLKKTV